MREKAILKSILRQFREKGRREPSEDVVAEEMEIPDATEEVANICEEVRLAYEVVAEEMSVAQMNDDADEDKPQVAVLGIEVACECNRYAQYLVPYEEKESIQIVMEVNDEEKEREDTSKKIEELEPEAEEMVKVCNRFTPVSIGQ